MTREVKTLLKQPLQVLSLRQNSPRWLAMRKRFRTASETPIIMGISPWQTPAQLAVLKFGNGNSETTTAMQHGHDWEPTARRRWQQRTLIRVEPVCMTRGPYMASLDGWSEQENEILEIKSPYKGRQSETWVLAQEREAPAHYYYQIQHQLLISGARLCHYWVFDSCTEKGIHLRYLPNYDVWAEIIDAWDVWWKKYGLSR